MNKIFAQGDVVRFVDVFSKLSELYYVQKDISAKTQSSNYEATKFSDVHARVIKISI